MFNILMIILGMIASFYLARFFVLNFTYVPYLYFSSWLETCLLGRKRSTQMFICSSGLLLAALSVYWSINTYAITAEYIFGFHGLGLLFVLASMLLIIVAQALMVIFAIVEILERLNPVLVPARWRS